MIRIAPSVLSGDLGNVAGVVASLAHAGADWIHLDVMDGHFVPNITFGPPVVEFIRKATTLPLDAHLMVTIPDVWIPVFGRIGVDWLSVHAEVCPHLHRTISCIREAGMKAGVALNPSTGIESVKWVLGDLDYVLLMSVNPGFSGQTFIPSVIEKARLLREEISRQNAQCLIEADGGVNADNARLLAEAGVDILVAGNYTFSGDMSARIRSLRACSES